MAWYDTFIWIILGIALHIGDVKCAACENTVSKKQPLNVTTIDRKLIKTVTSCGDLFRTFPDLCEDPDIGGPGGMCCKACGDVTCLDKVSSYTPYIVEGKAMTSCRLLIGKYKVICRTEGKKYGYCCRTCKKYDISCIDDELARYGGKTCKEYIREDRCNCDIEGVQETCCKSCKGFDPVKRQCKCRNFLSSDNPAIMKMKDGSGKVIENKEVTNCKEIVNYYAEACAQLGTEGEACCKECKGVDPDCNDLPGWEVTVTRRGKTCKDCSCHDLYRKGRSWMAYVCRQDLQDPKYPGMGARKACCLQCKRVGYK